MASRLLKGKQLKDLTITGAKIANTTITAGKVDKTGTWNFQSGDVQVSSTPAGVTSAVNKGYVGLDIRIIDAKTSEVVVATYVMGKAANYGFAAEPGPESKLPLSLSVFARTPAERAIRSAIQKAAADVVRMVPRNYFKY